MDTYGKLRTWMKVLFLKGNLIVKHNINGAAYNEKLGGSFYLREMLFYFNYCRNLKDFSIISIK